MADDIQFETPENVKLSYRLAGPGTRFVAWMMDIILLFILVFVLFIVALFAGASLDILQAQLRRAQPFGSDLYGHRLVVFFAGELPLFRDL